MNQLLLSKKHQPRKRFGQNFLHDQSIIGQIIDHIQAKSQDCLVEIGPGMGAITEPLLTKVEKLTIIELDTDLADSLRIRIGANANSGLTIIKANALELNYHELYQQLSVKYEDNVKMRIVGNLPYNISTPLLFHLLTFADVIEDMHFMLQKEVVDRITAEVNTKNYGRLSVMMQYYCQTDYLLTVPNGAFNPPPKVTSAVFRLTPYQDKPIVAHDEKNFALVVRETFNHRRKTLRAIFKKSAILPVINEQQLISFGLNPMARPETLTIADFVQLSNGITSMQSGI